MLKISWTEHKTNDKVLELAEEQRALMTTLRQRQKKWLGHVLHHDRLLKQVIERRMKRKKRGVNENVIKPVDQKRMQNGLFTAKEEGRRQN